MTIGFNVLRDSRCLQLHWLLLQPLMKNNKSNEAQDDS